MNTQASAGAEKLVSLIKPLIADVQVAQTKLLQEFIVSTISGKFEQINSKITAIEKSIENLDKKIAEKAINSDDMKDIKKTLASISNAVEGLKNNKASSSTGLPNNVRIRDITPQENMFDIDFDQKILD